MKHLFLAAGVLAAVACRAEVVDIDTAEAARLAAKGVPVIDVRTAPEWQETGVIGGSKLMTFFEPDGRSDPPAWVEKLKPVAKPDQPVILICRSGNRSLKAARYLSDQAGYRTVYNVKGGMGAWVKEGRATAPASAQVACLPPRKC